MHYFKLIYDDTKLVRLFYVACVAAVFVHGAAVEAAANDKNNSMMMTCNYTTSEIVGIVIGSVAITLVIVGLSLVFLWYLWKNNRLKLAVLMRKRTKAKHETVNIVAKKKNDVESGHEFAFDNPYFKDDDNELNNGNVIQDKTANQVTTIETHSGNKVITAKEKQQSSVKNVDSFEGCVNNQRNGFGKAVDDKKRLINSLPLANVFNHVSKQRQHQKAVAADDTFVNVKSEQVSVELTGHDFTGLGFNICGNMRDGIFVKDVMSRGPANESGKVKAGDRILNVTISFKNMVYEDALTILSYASPYNVQMLLEKSDAKENSYLNCVSSKRTYLPNNSAIASSGKLLHPLYRSQSVEDLSRIGRSSSEKSPASSSNSSQSVIQKLKSQLINRGSKLIGEKEYTSSTSDKKSPNIPTISIIENVDTNIAKNAVASATDSHIHEGTQNVHTSDNSVTHSPLNVKKLETSEKSAADIPSNIESNDSTPIKRETETISENEENSQPKYRPQPAPRKPATSGKKKGKAPQPPSSIITESVVSAADTLSSDTSDGHLPGTQLETTALIHQEDESISQSVDCSREENNDNQSSTISSLNTEKQIFEDECIQLGEEEKKRFKDQSRIPNAKKLKSSSLGDLTHATTVNGLKSVILERAVSLDLNGQHLPEANLCHHFNNILATSDVDYKNSENIALTKWSMKQNINTSSILTTSSSDCIGSSARISMNGQLGVVDYNDSFLREDDINKDEFPTSTPYKLNGVSRESISLYEDAVDTTTTSTTYGTPNMRNEREVMHNLHDSTTLEMVTCGDEPALSLDEINFEESETSKTLIETDAVDSAAKDERKEVIEISRNELDNVMMSYEEYMNFVEKQSQKVKRLNNDMQPPFCQTNVNTNYGIANMTANQLDFESWSYFSDHDASITHEANHTLNTSSSLNTDEEVSCDKHVPEVAGVTLKTS